MANVYWHADGGNWSDHATHWFNATDGGGGGHGAPPGVDDNAIFDANSFDNPGQTVTVDASATCLDMDWTGATNTPTFAGSQPLNSYGSLTFIAAMTQTYTGIIIGRATAPGETITAGGVLACRFELKGVGGGWTLQDALNIGSSNTFELRNGTLDTNGQTLTCGSFDVDGAETRVLTLGASVINCTAWDALGATNLTLNENTSTIKVTGTGAFAGSGETYNNVELNGTSHTVSGNNTFAKLTRNGTATKTDTLTLPAGGTQTMTTFEPKGNSVVNRVLVQSSILGTAATITATNWTGFQNVDVMDITDTNTEDLSAGSAGDAGGNTGITFTTAATQTYSAGGTNVWSEAGRWTSRVPLPQDDVTCGATVTVDMPRIGRSITFTGTPTITLSDIISNYGSFTIASGATYTHANKSNTLRGRGAFSFTANGNTIRGVNISMPTGTLTLNAVTMTAFLTQDFGTLTLASNVTASRYAPSLSPTVTWNLMSYTLTLNNTAAVSSLNIDPGVTVNTVT